MRCPLFALFAFMAPLSAQEFTSHALFVGTSSFQGEDVARFGRDHVFQSFFTVANGVRDVAFGPDGHLYVSSFNQDRVFVIDATGQERLQIGASSNLDGAWGLAFGPEGRLYVASVNSDSILVFERSGAFVTEFTEPSIASLRHLAFGPDGHLYVTTRDISNVGSVLVFDAAGNFVRTFATSLSNPEGITFDADGRLYVATMTTIRVYDLEGTLLDQIGAGSGLDQPHDLEVGPDGLLYAASFGSESIFAFDRQGTFVDEFGNNQINQPHGLAFAPKRLVAKVSAVAAENGQLLKLKRVATFSFFPGTGRMMIEYAAGEGLLASDAMVFEGFEVSTASNQVRMHHATSAPETVADRGLSSLALTVSGAPVDGLFTIKKAKGTLQGGRAGSAFSAKITVSKPLN